SRLRRLPSEDALPTGESYLMEMICHLLADEVSTLLLAGLVRDYVSEDEDLTVLRGSLRLREQMTRRFGRLDLLACRYDDFHADILINQLVLTGLSVAARLPVSASLKRRLRLFEGAVAQVANVGPTQSAFYRERLNYDRRTEHYRPAHQLCLLLL